MADFTPDSPTTTRHRRQKSVQNPLAELCPAPGAKIDGIAQEPGVLKEFKTNYSLTVDGKEYHYRWVPPGSRNPETFYVPHELLKHVLQVVGSTHRQEVLQRVEGSASDPSKETTSYYDSMFKQEGEAYAFVTWRANGAPVLLLPIPPADPVSRLAWASAIVHECTHARGFGEPLAFRQQLDYLRKHDVDLTFRFHEDGANLTALRHLGYDDVSLLFGLNEIAAERARIDDTPKLKTSSAMELYRTITGQLFRDEEFFLPLALNVLQYRSETGALTEIMRDEPRPSVKQAIDALGKYARPDFWEKMRSILDEKASHVTNRKNRTPP